MREKEQRGGEGEQQRLGEKKLHTKHQQENNTGPFKSNIHF